MENSKLKPDFQILLIGGASGVGKTRLSYRLARHYQMNLTEVDDFQVILEKMTTPQQQPLLHYWHTHRTEFNLMSEEERTAHFIRVCQEVFTPALEAVIANHLESNTPLVLEGDFILPALAVQTSFDGIEVVGQVRGLFIYEPEESQIARNFGEREGREQLGRARASWLFSEWLRQECQRLKVAAIPARPWQTGLERALMAVNTGQL